MRKTKRSHKILALFLNVIMLNALLPYNMLYANNNGPYSPEAAGFEPVDATDMVNLATGDLSYVLPLLNVPSPEGGYPLALSYHAGIAMDQEASWVGLGWTLNPGAINRSVNVYPDDWYNAKVENIIYNQGQTITDFQSTLNLGTQVSSLALSLNYNTNKGFYGSVGLNLGPVSYDSEKGVGIRANMYIPDTNIGIGVTKWSKTGDTSITFSFEENKLSDSKNGLGINMSSGGIGFNASSQGIGSTMSVPFRSNFSNKLTARSSFVGSFTFQAPFWGISLNYKKTHYSLYDSSEFQINGVLNPFSETNFEVDNAHDLHLKTHKIFDVNNNIPAYDSYMVSAQGINGLFSPKHLKKSFVVSESRVGTRSFQNEDNYEVERSVKSSIIDPNKIGEFSLNNNIHFYFNNVQSSFVESTLHNRNLNMQLDKTLPISDIDDFSSDFNTNLNQNGKTYNNYDLNSNRKTDANFIESFTVAEMLNGNAIESGLVIHKSPSKNDDYLNKLFENVNSSAIGGFKITVSDGKTYHYSLPVYQQEEFIREYVNELDEYGNISKDNSSSEFSETRKYTPYATHWLLTAITGPDYIKNDVSRNYPDNDDFGYWIRFDYGKWSDGFAWSGEKVIRKYLNTSRYAYANTRRGESTSTSDDDLRPSERPPNSEIHIESNGIKQVYYLNKVKTRSHSALFVKSLRTDSKGKNFKVGESKYSPKIYTDVVKSINTSQMNIQFDDVKIKQFINTPSQNSLKLDKIVLLKNDDATNINCEINNTLGVNGSFWIEEEYVQSNVLGQYYGTTKRKIHERNWQTENMGNILDVDDIDPALFSKAKKVIEFKYSDPTIQSKNSIYLDKILIGGKSGKKLIPPYKFSYYDFNFNFQDQDDVWGFNSIYPKAWSLKNILTPTGGNIFIDYESDSYYSILRKEEKGRISNSDFQREQLLGGGLRVKNIQLKASGKLKGREDYFYEKFGTELTSGVSLYVPENEPKNVDLLPMPQVYYGNVQINSYGENNKLINKKQYGFNVFSLENIDYSDDPTNLDEFFKIENSLGSNLGPFDAGEILRDGSYTGNNDRFMDLKILDKRIIDNFHTIGYPIFQKNFNINDQLITSNFIELSSPQDIKLGRVEEAYNFIEKQEDFVFDYRNDPILGVLPNWDVNVKRRKSEYLIGTIIKTTLPVSVKRSRLIYNSLIEESLVSEFDFNTGQPLETLTETSDGLEIKTKAVPAYTKYPEMGSKVDNPSNRNMLVQNAGNLTQIKIGNEWKTIGADITTWNNNWEYYDYKGGKEPSVSNNDKVWRKHQTYVWKGPTDPLDGSYLGYSGDFDGFKWGLGDTQTNPDWFRVSTTKTYDHYSMPLEVFDANDNYVSTKMGDKETKVFSVSNAPYMAHFYSGAEDLDTTTRYFGGQVSTGTGTSINTSNTHSGSSAVQANANAKAFIVKPISGEYRASVWVKKNSGYANTRLKVGSEAEIAPIAQETVFAGQWVQYNFKFTQNSSSSEVYVYNKSATGIFDDFRVYPVESSLTSYVYNEWDELTHILGANNMGTRYEYDEAGRLKRVFAEVQDEGGKSGGFKLAKEINYNYKRVAELDTNGNGILEPAETYDPLSLYLRMDYPEDYYSSEVKATASGGSGNYQYRWAQSTDQNNLTYGKWTNQSVNFSTVNCPNNVNYIKCQVKDMETGKTYETTIIHFRACSGGGGGPILEPYDGTN
ncbi:hypothetical protein [Leeuwenhoekiella sp. H156]|uniref:hypothetical protein n=1 Tax=Leeuwenhoekiella sp. H156 TaxID=3450128 RepID=UPI003FA45416